MMATIMIDPGMLRTELALQAATLIPDGMGGSTEDWTETALVFARVEPASAHVFRRANRDVQEVTHRMTIRYRDGIEPGMRFVKSNRIFRILTVIDPDETGRYLVLNTAEETP
jgi:SPP1 family predicted phage head-tail adaptor